jgi:hypothetical protein
MDKSRSLTPQPHGSVRSERADIPLKVGGNKIRASSLTAISFPKGENVIEVLMNVLFIFLRARWMKMSRKY